MRDGVLEYWSAGVMEQEIALSNLYIIKEGIYREAQKRIFEGIYHVGRRCGALEVWEGVCFLE